MVQAFAFLDLHAHVWEVGTNFAFSLGSWCMPDNRGQIILCVVSKFSKRNTGYVLCELVSSWRRVGVERSSPPLPPKLWVKPSRGPIWELNRRTGLVTVFDYKNNGEYKKNGTIGEVTAPFYEFDAYISTTPDRQGLPVNVLYLAHRYRDIVINFRPIMPPGEGELLCALWDFIQNYMDTSRPLPDLPRYEEFRHLDPVTADFDRKVNRNPRLWIDMNDQDYKHCLRVLRTRIDEIDTFHRPNLMAQFVEYVD